MEATTLHMAAAGGHDKIVKILLDNGANAEDENAVCFLSIFFLFLENSQKSRCGQFSPAV